MAQITNILPVLSGQTLDADIHRLNFNNIIPKYNEHDRNKTGIHGIAGSTEIGTVKYYTDFIDGVNPVGSILEVWDNEIPAVKALIDTDYYVEFNGTTISDAESIFNELTIPDYTEVYLMVETNSNLSTSTTYNDNTLDLTHTHDLTHDHTFNHDHTAAATHTHTKDTGAVEIYYNSSSDRLYFHYKSGTSWDSDERGENFSYSSDGSTMIYGQDIDYTVLSSAASYNDFTDNSSNKTSSDKITYENSSTFATPIDIKLYSIKCRRYLRIK